MRGTTRRRKLTRTSFLADLPNQEARSVAEKLFDVAVDSGAILRWRSTSVSIRMRCSLSQHPVSVAWLYPPGVKGLWGFENISFGAAIFGYENISPKLLEFLDEWVGGFADDEYADLMAASGAKAWSVSYADAAKHLETLTDRLTGVLSKMKEL